MFYRVVTTWGRYGVVERQTTGWLGTCRNTFPYQTTNIDGGGVPLWGAVVGTKLWRAGGERLDRYLYCMFRGCSCLHVLPRFYAVSIHVSSLFWVDAAGGSPQRGAGGGWSGGSREPTNFAFDNSAYRWSNGSDIWLLLSISTTGIIGRKKKQRSRPISRCGPLILRYMAFMLCAPRKY